MTKLALFYLLIATAQAAIAPTASTKGFGKVIAGLAAEGCDQVTTACLLTSRSVTSTERKSVAQQLIGEQGDAADGVVLGNAQHALAVAQPQTTADVVRSTVAAGGNLVYCPSSVDLARGEGLMETLAPAMQVIVQQGLSKTATLWIVVEDPQQARQQLQASVDWVLARTLSPSGKPLKSLEDVFASVQYVTPTQALEGLTQKRDSATDAASRVAIASKTGSVVTSVAESLSPSEVAAARTLGPIARRATSDAVATVHAQCRDDNQQPVRVVDFGQLAQAALASVSTELASAASAMPGSSVANQMKNAAQAQLEFTLQADFEEQLKLLQEECFQSFRKALSKLIIGPNLAADMQKVAQTSMAAFAKQSKRLVAPSASGWSTTAAQAALATRLRETITTRLQAARASGKFRPLPRKGVTIGLHWLLPKPFGNDFRQEPWLVHASDNLVYVPADKVTEVSPEAVVSGADWRNQIVPSPVGNDMIFMQ